MAGRERTADQRFLILGFPRSGTTVLSQLLDAHPEISCPPETNLFSGAGRFLAEQTAVEGPPIGVLAGLAFVDIAAEDVLAPLRDFLFAFHDRIAGDAPIWVEKTATDIFHVEALEPLLVGHARFVVLVRHPLDVIASNHDLAEVMGAQLPEIFELTRGVNGPFDGYARAWLDRMTAVSAFVERHPDACHVLRYEDLMAAPEARLDELFRFMGAAPCAGKVLKTAFAQPKRVGLGDFRAVEMTGLRPPASEGWRRRLPRAAAARIVPLLAPMMERYGYAVPKMPRQPTREQAVRQLVMASNMRRSISHGSEGGAS